MQFTLQDNDMKSENVLKMCVNLLCACTGLRYNLFEFKCMLSVGDIKYKCVIQIKYT